MAILKEVLFNDGEGVVHTDVNNVQRFANSLLLDAVVGPLCGTEGAGGPLDSVCYAIKNGGAVYAHGSNAREVRFQEGTILVAAGTSTPDGNAPNLRPFYMTEDDVSTKQRPVATVNPRWDILSVRIAESSGDSATRHFKDAVTGALTSQSIAKRLNWTATFTWTQGTEDASPTEPSTPAGDVKICAVKITPAMTTFNSDTDMRDYRVPLGSSKIRSMVRDCGAPELLNSATYSDANSLYYRDIDTNGGAKEANQLVGSPLSDCHHRLERIEIFGEAGTSANHELTLLGSRDGFLGGIWTSNSIVPTTYGISVFQQGSNPPLWANGYSAGYAAFVAGLDQGLFLLWAIANGEASAQLGEVIWRYHGL